MSEIKERPAPFRVSDSAFRRLNAIKEAEGRDGLRLRVGVSGGGCSGFQYLFDLDDSEEEGDVILANADTSVVVDGTSLMFLIGAEIDYVEDLTGSYFRVVNPNAKSSCGCGSSFAV